MDYRYKQLEQELSSLKKAFAELGAQLSEVSKEVTSPGIMPPEKLLEQISASRTSFENFRAAIHGHAAAMLVSPLPALGELLSIANFDSLLKASAVAEETKFSVEGEREAVLNILARVLAISHRETGDFKPLLECHARIAELRNAIGSVVWPDRHAESQSIVESRHPTTALLYFVENLDQLDDDRWMALETTITETYGKPLFVAASRGKLAARAEGKPETASKPPATTAPTPARMPAAAPQEPARPAVAAERPVERKPIERIPEKPAASPIAPPAATVAAPPPAVAEKKPMPPAPPAQMPAERPRAVAPTAAPTMIAEKKPAPQMAPQPAASTLPAPPPSVAPVSQAPTASAPTASAPTASAPTASAPAMAPSNVAPVNGAPVNGAPVNGSPVNGAPAHVAPPRPPAQAPMAVSPAPSAPAAAPSAPPASGATPAASPLTVSMNSLSALANATDTPEKKPASPAADTIDKQRKEPRLAASPNPQSVAKPEFKPQEMPENPQQGMIGDSSQRPQRWGFWRGNR